MEIILTAQEYTIDAALGINRLNFGEKYQEKFAIVDIPIRNLLNADDTTNYTKAKRAALELMKIYHTVETPVIDKNGNPKTYSDGRRQYQFVSFHLIDKVTVNQKPGIVSVKLGEETWSQILDMGKGYTRYNLLTAKSLDDVVAMRLYQIMSNTVKPLRFSIERIKGILGLTDKYVSDPNGFVRRVIEPAEKEIEEKCPFKVVHELEYNKSSRKGRPSIVGISFNKTLNPTIMHQPVILDPYLKDSLIENFGFDEKGIRSNLKLFIGRNRMFFAKHRFIKKHFRLIFHPLHFHHQRSLPLLESQAKRIRLIGWTHQEVSDHTHYFTIIPFQAHDRNDRIGFEDRKATCGSVKIELLIDNCRLHCLASLFQ